MKDSSEVRTRIVREILERIKETGVKPEEWNVSVEDYRAIDEWMQRLSSGDDFRGIIRLVGVPLIPV
jgi:hypothetical protein